MCVCVPVTGIRISDPGSLGPCRRSRRARGLRSLSQPGYRTPLGLSVVKAMKVNWQANAKDNAGDVNSARQQACPRAQGGGQGQQSRPRDANEQRDSSLSLVVKCNSGFARAGVAIAAGSWCAVLTNSPAASSAMGHSGVTCKSRLARGTREGWVAAD